MAVAVGKNATGFFCVEIGGVTFPQMEFRPSTCCASLSGKCGLKVPPSPQTWAFWSPRRRGGVGGTVHRDSEQTLLSCLLQKFCGGRRSPTPLFRGSGDREASSYGDLSRVL